jgi:exosome complex component RRP43
MLALERIVWVLYIDLVCLDHSGNIMDASISVLISALKTVTLPSVAMGTDTGEVVVSDKKITKLKLDSSLNHVRCVQQHHQHLPLPVVRPHPEKEQLSSSLVTVVTTDGDDVCHLHQPGEDQLRPQLLQQAVQLATHRGVLLYHESSALPLTRSQWGGAPC